MDYCIKNCVKNEEKQSYYEEHNSKITIKELEVLKQLSDKILSNLNNYLSK